MKVETIDAPLVSIGVPVYNGESVLPRALDSLLAQTYRNVEIVVCDNASTDGTEEICREYAARDRRIRYVRNPTNIGCNPNFWKTFQLSRGEFFMWASADDSKPTSAVEECVLALQQNPNAVLAYGPILMRWAGKEELVEVANPLPMSGYGPCDRIRLLVRELQTNVIEYGLCRKEAIQKVVYGNHYGSDTLFLIQMCFLGEFAYIPSPIIIYEKRDDLIRGVMYEERTLNLQNLLTVPKHVRKKCWMVLLLGMYYMGKLQGPTFHEKFFTVYWFVITFVAKYRRLLAKEIVFQAAAPFVCLADVIWKLSKRSAISKKIGKRLHRVVFKT